MRLRLIIISLCLLLVCFALPACASDVWSAPFNLSQHSDYNRWACVFGDADGWHYSYMQGDQDNSAAWRMEYRTQLANGTWLAPAQVGNVSRSEESRNSRFADGTHFIVFQGLAADAEWYFSQYVGSAWSTPTVLTPNDGLPDLSTDSDKVFDVDSDDTIHLLNQHTDGNQYNMRYYEKTRTGGIVDHGDVLDSGDYQLNGAIKATGTGASKRVHCQVVSGTNVPAWRCYYRRWNNPGWGPSINMSSLLPVNPDGAHTGGIAQLPDGRLVACLGCADSNPGGSWDIWLLFSSDNGGTWGSPVNVSQNSGLSRSPSMTANSDGDVVVAWEDNTRGSMEIMARRWRAGRLGPTYILGSGFTVSAASYGKASRVAWHQYVVDNWEIVTCENPGADSTAPAPVSGFAADSSDGAVYVRWTNPSDADSLGTMVRYKTSGYPTSASDGTLLCEQTATPGSAGSFAHTGVTNGVTYYYAAFACDIGPNYSTAMTAQATPRPQTPADAKLRKDATSIDLKNVAISAIFDSDSCIYVEDPNRTSGIRVAHPGTGYSLGNRINVSGTISTRTMNGYPSERQISGPTLAWVSGGTPLKPLAMNCETVGGAGVSPYMPGVSGGIGTNNIGLLVKIAGKVTLVLGNYVYLDDGGDIDNGDGTVGVMVESPSTPTVVTGNIVSATGIVQGSIPSGSTENRRYIKLRSGGDLNLISSNIGTISGYVTDSEWTGISGAVVSTTSGGYSTTTDGSGAYTLTGVTAGRHTVEATKAGYTTTSEDITLSSGQNLSLDLVINPNTGTIQGLVRNSSSVGIPGATVTTNTGGYTATTNSSGAYTISYVTPGSYNVTASKAGYTGQTLSGKSVTAGNTTYGNFVLTAGP